MGPPSTARLGPLLVALLIGLFIASGFPQPSQAQRAKGRFGIGAQAGRPSGLTAKLYRHAQLGYDLALVGNLDHYFFASLHRVHEQPIPNSPLHLFAGPGVFAGADGLPLENNVTFGISGNFGLNFFRGSFEVFLQMTPRLRLYPNTRGRLGGSVGLRYFF